MVILIVKLESSTIIKKTYEIRKFMAAVKSLMMQL